MSFIEGSSSIESRTYSSAVPTPDHLDPATPALSTIAILPAELLCSIFLAIIVLDPYNVDAKENDELDVRMASQVCRQWRALILDCPDIWGRLFCLDHASESWNAEVLRRSKSSALHLRSMDYSDAFISALQHMNRVKVFDVEQSGWNNQQMRENVKKLDLVVLTRQLPFLESFRWWLNEFLVFPNTSICLGQAPNLRFLSLKCVDVDILQHGTSLCTFPNLTHLHVSRGVKFYIIEYLQVLSRLPKLEQLQLDHALLRSPQSDADSLIRVTLPQLTLIELQGPIDLYWGFLSYLSIPSRCSVRCSMLVLDTSQDYHVKPFALFIEEHTSQWRPDDLTDSFSILIGHKLVEINTLVDLHSSRCPLNRCELFIELYTAPERSKEGFMKLIAEPLLQCMGPFQNSRRLMLSITGDTIDNHLYSLLSNFISKFTSVSDLRTSGNIMLQNVITFMMRSYSSCDILLPALNSMHISLDWATDITPDIPVIPKLREFLLRREKHGKGIHRVHVVTRDRKKQDDFRPIFRGVPGVTVMGDF